MKYYLIQIKSDGTLVKVPSKEIPTLEDLQALVGGYIEVIPTRITRTENGPMMVVNEEGKLLGLPRNDIATFLGCSATHPLEDYIVGDVVLVLERGEDLKAMTLGQTKDNLWYTLSLVLEQGEGWIVAPYKEVTE